MVVSEHHHDEFIRVDELYVDDRRRHPDVWLKPKPHAIQSARDFVALAHIKVATFRDGGIVRPPEISRMDDLADAQLLDRFPHGANRSFEELALEVGQHLLVTPSLWPVELGILRDPTVECAQRPPNHLFALSPFCNLVESLSLAGTPSLENGITSGVPGTLEEFHDESVDFPHARTLLQRNLAVKIEMLNIALFITCGQNLFIRAWKSIILAKISQINYPESSGLTN